MKPSEPTTRTQLLYCARCRVEENREVARHDYSTYEYTHDTEADCILALGKIVESLQRRMDNHNL